MGEVMKTHLTAERLRELLDYNPLTGVFYWKQNYHRRLIGSAAGSLFVTAKGYRYLRIRVSGRNYFSHRLAYLWMTGKWPDHHVDHRDGNGLNNRWRNLRDASQSQNRANATCRRNKVGLKGVTAHKSPCTGIVRYEARIAVDGKRICLGTFLTPEVAHAAYVAAAEKHFGEFARAG
jgi:outer membrane protein assembly factor BamB